MGANSCVNRGKRDIVVGACEKWRTVVGFVMRLSCRGTRESVERSDCIRLVVLCCSDDDDLWKVAQEVYILQESHSRNIATISEDLCRVNHDAARSLGDLSGRF